MRNSFSRFLKFLVHLPQRWFVLGLLVVMILAWLWPEAAQDKGEISLKTLNQACVAFIFLLNGMSIKKAALFKSLKKYKLHLLIQVFCFLLFPTFVLLLNDWIFIPMKFLAPQFVIGTSIMACLPISNSSCVILTQLTDGDETSALFNALLSNLIGFFVTPFVMNFLFPSDYVLFVINPWVVVSKLGLFTLLPMVVGYLLCTSLSKQEKCFGDKISWMNQVFLLFIIYMAFCQTFLQSEELSSPWTQVLLLTLTLCLIHIVVLTFAYILGKVGEFKTSEQKAILFTTSQKTLALGIPLITILTASLTLDENAAPIGLYVLPLLIYNNIQTVAAIPLAYWLKGKKGK